MNSNSTMVRQDKWYNHITPDLYNCKLLVHVIIIVSGPQTLFPQEEWGEGKSFITHEIKCPFMVVKCYPICSTAIPNVFA